MTEIQKAMHWLLNGSTGMSSKCLMATMLNGSPVIGGQWATEFHPRDPADFNRCVGLLNAVPSFRNKLEIMKLVSKEWLILIDHWDELENLLSEERRFRTCPKMYNRMEELFAMVEKDND